MDMKVTGLSKAQVGSLQKGLAALGHGGKVEPLAKVSAVDPAAVEGPDTVVAWLLEAGDDIEDLATLRRRGVTVPVLVLCEESPKRHQLKEVGAVAIAPPGILSDPKALALALANLDLWQQSRQETRALEEQLREAEEVKFQLRLESEAMRQRLEAGDADEPLTGLRSERSMARSVEEAFNLARRYQTPVACLLIGVEDFDSVGERFGGAFAELVEAQIAHRCKTCLRSTDLLSRYRDGEFLLLSPFTTPEGARILGERLREAVAGQRLEHEGKSLSLSASVGVANWHLRLESSTELVEAAAGALAQARGSGGTVVVAQ